MKIGPFKDVDERIAWLKANLRPATPEEIIAQKREAQPKCEVVKLSIVDPVRRQVAIDSVWLATKGKSSYDRSR
jgi:hypothetical protein